MKKWPLKPDFHLVLRMAAFAMGYLRLFTNDGMTKRLFGNDLFYLRLKNASGNIFLELELRMRAVLQEDPFHGAGYGIIAISDLAAMDEPSICLIRLSDGKYLGFGGWSADIAQLPISRWETEENNLKIWLDPSVIDNMDPAQKYEIYSANGTRCPLKIISIKQSRLINLNGLDTDAPPPDPENTFSPVYPYSETVFSGVSPTPMDSQENEKT